MTEGIIPMSGGEEERGDSILDSTLQSLGDLREGLGRGVTFSDEEKGDLEKLVGSAAGKVKRPGMMGVGGVMAARGRRAREGEVCQEEGRLLVGGTDKRSWRRREQEEGGNAEHCR